MTVRSDQGRQPSALVAPKLGEAVTFALAASLVLALGMVEGGYYPRAWGWAGLAALAVALSRLFKSRNLELSGREWLMLALLATLLAWIAVTATQPDVATGAVSELERGGLYLTVLWSAFVVLRREAVGACLGGVLTGITAVSCRGLEAYLFPRQGVPNVFEERLLYQPLGYANASGILAAMGVALALGLATHGRHVRARALAAGSLVPLVATLAFTSSRGAVASLVLAVGAMLALDPARRRLAATATVTLPLPLLAVWVSSRTRLGDAQVSSTAIAHDGRVIAALIALLTAALTAFALVALRHDGRIATSRRLGLAALLSSSIAGTGAVAAAVAMGAGGTLGDRPAYWQAAWADYRAHPLLGSGAGSFGAAWLHYRAAPVSTLDAHNLYLETLAELGPLGLALLVGVFAIPLIAIVINAREQPLAVPASGAFVAFLAHAALDWDWEMPVVTVAALVAAASVLVVARTPKQHSRAPTLRAVALSAAASVALAAATAFGLAGNSALAAAAAEANSGSWGSAQRLARTASWWEPWSAEPQVLLGEVQLAAGNRAAARRSFARAVLLDSQDWRAWYELARVTSLGARHHAIERIAWLNPMAVQLESQSPASTSTSQTR